MSLNLIERAPGWLRFALNLQETHVPQHLDTSVVVPVVDLLQGGYERRQTWVDDATTGAGVVELVDPPAFVIGSSGGPQVTEEWSVWVLSIHAINGAAAGIGNLYLSQLGPGGASAVHWSLAMAANEIVGSDRILPGGPLLLPPGFKLRCQGHGAADVSFAAVCLALPPGVRPW